MDRPRHVSQAIDHMLSTWNGRATIDPARIGVFGFSSGGFTALASIGVPDFSSVGPMCAQYPGDYSCRMIAKSGTTVAAVPKEAVMHAVGPRIKSAVVAAPALGFTFGWISATAFDRAAFHASFNAAVVRFFGNALGAGSSPLNHLGSAAAPSSSPSSD